MKTLYLIFNHELTNDQFEAARKNLDVHRFEKMPDTIKTIWEQIPPNLTDIDPYLAPLREWLAHAAEGDFVLVQGDFGAVFIMVNYAFAHGLIPIYSTTARQAVESQNEDGSMNLSHTFRHVRFREYGR